MRFFKAATITALLLCSSTSICILALAQTQKKTQNTVKLLTPKGLVFTKADTLRGSITPERAWWDALRYEVTVRPDYQTKSLRGSVKLVFAVTPLSKQSSTQPATKTMQLDLQQPLVVDSIVQLSPYRRVTFRREQNVWYAENLALPTKKSIKLLKDSLVVYYHGTPREAIRPPWGGGWIWEKDSLGRPWMSVACQGLGASAWYPCKDHQSDEPNEGAVLTVIVPDTLVAVGNGRMLARRTNNDGTASFTWRVQNPINTYNVVPYIGKYAHWSDTLRGAKGRLDLDFWVLDYDSTKAWKQFQQVKPMLRCFEHWFGAYPFYQDGYKLVQSPHLGMEHQSAVAYGNGFNNGFRGRIWSGTEWGLKWDFIIVHESGHEWFANNITTKDIADMWVHEGFTCYSETLYTEWLFGKEAGDEYNRGIRKNILNDEPIIAPYGINQTGSSDMYCKAANMLHIIRRTMDNDERFRGMLRGLNTTYYHATVTTQEVERFINKFSGIDFSTIFDQYLRTTQVPTIRYAFSDDSTRVSVRWDSCVKGFALPICLGEGANRRTLRFGEAWQTLRLASNERHWFTVGEIEKRYYVRLLSDTTATVKP